jgi:hypothetical protein
MGFLSSSVEAAAAAAGTRAAGTGRRFGLALADGDDREHALEILGVTGRASGLGVAEHQFLELAGTLATNVFVERHGVLG